jgi:hypothetical protein
MLNFQAIRDKEMTLADLVAGLTCDELGPLTDEMIDTMLGLIAECMDEEAHLGQIGDIVQQARAARGM